MGSPGALRLDHDPVLPWLLALALALAWLLGSFGFGLLGAILFNLGLLLV